MAFKKAGLNKKETRGKKQWLLEKPVGKVQWSPLYLLQVLAVWPGSLQFPHRRILFAGGWLEEVDVELPEVGVVGGPWVVVMGGVSGMGHTRSRTSSGQYSRIVS